MDEVDGVDEVDDLCSTWSTPDNTIFSSLIYCPDRIPFYRRKP